MHLCVDTCCLNAVLPCLAWRCWSPMGCIVHSVHPCLDISVGYMLYMCISCVLSSICFVLWCCTQPRCVWTICCVPTIGYMPHFCTLPRCIGCLDALFQHSVWHWSCAVLCAASQMWFLLMCCISAPTAPLHVYCVSGLCPSGNFYL